MPIHKDTLTQKLVLLASCRSLVRLLIAAILLISVTIQAQTLPLTKAGHHPTGNHWQYQESPAIAPIYISTKFTNIISSTDWTMNTHDYINFGFRRNAYWLKMELNNLTDDEWFLWNHYSLLDTVALYICPSQTENSELCSVQYGGDLHPYHPRAVDHPNLIFPLNLEKNTSYDLYLYVATEGTYQLPLEIIDSKSLNQNLLNNNLLRGGYYAVMLAMGLYNLMLFFAIRDRTYFLYSTFVLSFLFFHMNFEGSAFGYFWPEEPHWNKVMMPLSFAITQFFFSLFLPRILELKKYAPSSWLLYRIYTPVTVLFMVLAFVAPYYFSVSLQNLVNSVVAVYTLIVAIRVWRLGHKPARLFTLAWITFIIGTILGNISSLGIVPRNALVLYGYQIGSILDVILLSLALGAQINQLRSDREKDQQRLNKSQVEAINNLKKYEDLYQNAIAGRFQLNGQGVVTGCNPAFAKNLGYKSADDVIAAQPHIDQFIRSPEAAVELWQTLEKKGQIQGYQISMMPRRGKAVEGILTMRREPNSATQYWVGSLIDITESYERELELERLEETRDLSVRQLVMGISHEMNTPIGNIRLASSHLSEQLSLVAPLQLKGELDEGVQHISHSIDRLVELNDVIQSSLAESTEHKPESTHLHTWLRSWKERTHSRFDFLDIEVICTPENSLWHGHVEIFDDILLQLIDNSVTHNPELYADNKLYVRVSAALYQGTLNLQYQDNGKGVRKEDQDKVLLPFYTTQRTRAKKKGLGMFEVHNLITRIMKGYIEWPSTSTGFAIILILPDFNQPEEKNDGISI
jgi:PAS domain S-box-containing protein